MQIKSVDSFETLSEAIAYYTCLVSQCSKSRDYSNMTAMLEFKDQLHNRIEKERESKWTML
ncbi:MAG: hypothetical protein ACQEWV_06690 [Bacillota bacterium]